VSIVSLFNAFWFSENLTHQKFRPSSPFVTS
jgi:hypothetical protein